MAPGIHPPCTPSASCQSPRCHPTPPPCEDPEKCLKTTIAKKCAPCESALSIMATRARRGPCSGCGKFNSENKDDPRKVEYIKEYLARKSYEANLKRNDQLTGGHSYLDYQRDQGKVRGKEECCAGKGHRGRLMKDDGKKKKKKKNQPPPFGTKKKKKCTIL